MKVWSRTPPNSVSSLEFSIEDGINYADYPVLVVDDEPENLHAFRLNFAGEFSIFTARSGAEALDVLPEREFAVVISDQRMPGMSGLELLEKTTKRYPHLIRIVLTGYTDHESLIRSINKARIYQYVTKPWQPDELGITIKRAIERYAVEAHNRRLIEDLRIAKEEVEAKLRRSMTELTRANERLRKLATSDGLTGLYNHRYFQERWRREVKRAKRYDEQLSLMIIDVDHFKTYNDSLGHPQGDALLKEMANLLSTSVREVDLVARYGGDEFVIVLPKAPKESAHALGERIRRRVAAQEFPSRQVLPKGHLSTSIGVATFPDDGARAADVILAADQALYVAKDRGRNCVISYDPETAGSSPTSRQSARAGGGSEDSDSKRQLAAREASDREAAAAKAAQDAADAARRAAEAAQLAAQVARQAASEDGDSFSDEHEAVGEEGGGDFPSDVSDSSFFKGFDGQDSADESSDLSVDILTDEGLQAAPGPVPAGIGPGAPLADLEATAAGSDDEDEDDEDDEDDRTVPRFAQADARVEATADSRSMDPADEAAAKDGDTATGSPAEQQLRVDAGRKSKGKRRRKRSAASRRAAQEGTQLRATSHDARSEHPPPGSHGPVEPSVEADAQSSGTKASEQAEPAGQRSKRRKPAATLSGEVDTRATQPLSRSALAEVEEQVRRRAPSGVFSRTATARSVPTLEPQRGSDGPGQPALPSEDAPPLLAALLPPDESPPDLDPEDHRPRPSSEFEVDLAEVAQEERSPLSASAPVEEPSDDRSRPPMSSGDAGDSRRFNVAGAPDEFAPLEVVAGGDPDSERERAQQRTKRPPLPPSLQHRVHDVSGITGAFEALLVERGDDDLDPDESDVLDISIHDDEFQVDIED